MFSDDDEENKIKKDSKIFINLFVLHLFSLFFKRRWVGGWVSGWEGRGGASLKTEEIDYIS